MMGTGTTYTVNLLCNKDWTSSAVDVALVHELFLVLQPTLAWMVECTLGPSWLALGITFQMFQSLLCEVRKASLRTNERRPGHASREQHYMELIKVVAHAFGINLDDVPGVKDRPVLNLPSCSNGQAVSYVLDVFGALLLRFAEDILKRKEVPILRSSAARLRSTRKFKATRINQFHYLLDRGSLANFTVTLEPMLSQHFGDVLEAGWFRRFDFVAIADNKWLAELLPQLALSHTILAEGMCRSEVGAVDLCDLKALVAHEHRFKYPYGRALGAVGNINPILTGDWGFAAAQ